MTTTLRPQNGFSLIEVLLSILVFSLGMVGVALYTANGLKNSANNHARATVLRSTSLALEPVINQANSSASLAAALQTFAGANGVAVANDNDKDSFTLRATTFQNGDGAITTALPGTLISPVTVAFSIPYTGADGNQVTLSTSYSFFF